MIIITGGGTGGHFYPAMALAEGLLKEGIRVHYIGSYSGIEKDKINQYNIPFSLIKVKPYKLTNLLQNFWETLKILKIMMSIRPNMVVGFGGYVMTPVIMVSLLLRIPYFLQEQNAIAGRANKLFSKWAKKIFTGYVEANVFFPSDKVVFTGTPIREEFIVTNRDTAAIRFDFPDKLPVVLILGGSRGSRFLNEVGIKLIPCLIRNYGLNIVHLTGDENLQKITKEDDYEELSNKWKIYPFLNNIWDAIAIADLAITRGGGSILAELSLFNLKAIVIPYPYAMNDHQYSNGLAHIRNYGGLLLREHECTPERLKHEIISLLKTTPTTSQDEEKKNSTESIISFLKQYL